MIQASVLQFYHHFQEKIKYCSSVWHCCCSWASRNGRDIGQSTPCSGGSRPLDKGGGGGGGRSSRPWDKERGAVLKKIFFRPFGPQLGLKIRGGRAPRAPPLDPPLRMPCTWFHGRPYFVQTEISPKEMEGGGGGKLAFVYMYVYKIIFIWLYNKSKSCNWFIVLIYNREGVAKLTCQGDFLKKKCS